MPKLDQLDAFPPADSLTQDEYLRNQSLQTVRAEIVSTGIAQLGAAASELDQGSSTNWRSRGKCRGTETAVMYPINSAADIKTAKSICKNCPVEEICFDYVMQNPREYGVWAGTTEGERRKIRKNRRIADAIAAQAKSAPEQTINTTTKEAPVNKEPGY